MVGKVIIGGVLLIALLIALEWWFKRGRHRPLSSLRPGRNAPAKPELGMEETDLSVVDKANWKNNEAARHSGSDMVKKRMRQQPYMPAKQTEKGYAERFGGGKGQKKGKE